jgi:hypothetical protein
MCGAGAQAAARAATAVRGVRKGSRWNGTGVGMAGVETGKKVPGMMP